MSVVLSLTALSLQYVADSPWSCIGYWNMLTGAALLFVLQFLRSWSAASWVAFVTCGLAAIKAFALLPYSYVQYQDQVPNLGAVAPFGAQQNDWSTVGLALSCIPYAMTPVFISVEMLSEASVPLQYKKALGTAAGCMCVMYTVAGVAGACMWGSSIANPVTLEIPRGWVGIMLNAFLALASGLDYVIGSIVVNAEVAKLAPRLYWILQSLPSTLLAVLVVCTIPSFSVLVGVFTGFTIVGANTFVISFCWMLGSFPGTRKLHMATLVGVPLSGYIIAAAVDGIINASYSSYFFCDG